MALVKMSWSPWRRAVDGHQQHPVGQAGHGQPVPSTFRTSMVPARDERQGLRGHLEPPPRSAWPRMRGPGLRRARRPGRPRTAAHGVDVGQRVRGRDPAPVGRVVDDRGEEVRGPAPSARSSSRRSTAASSPSAAPTERGRRAGRAHAGGALQAGEQLFQLGQRQLAGAARAGRQRGQPGRGGFVLGRSPGGHCSRGRRPDGPWLYAGPTGSACTCPRAGCPRPTPCARR